MNGWVEYKHEPCPICGHEGWCGHTEDGNVIHCMRTESKNVCASGGWFHFLVDRPMRPCFVPKAPSRPARRFFDAERVMAGFRAEIESYKGGDIFDGMLAIGRDLNLAACYVDRLLVGCSSHYMSWCFPMRDAKGKTIGIRLRRYGSSDKFSVSGSRDGLFYDPELKPREYLDHGLHFREIVIVEGATDCIAGYALGLPAVGRSACATGTELLRGLCGRLKVNRVTIVSDNDGSKFRADGTEYKPGIEGAEKLAAQLGRNYRIVIPPKKDLREWYYAGLTTETFLMVANLQPWKIAQPIRKQRRGPIL